MVVATENTVWSFPYEFKDEIWGNVRNSLKNEFDSKPVYHEK